MSHHPRLHLSLLLALASLCSMAQGQFTWRVNVTSTGQQSNGDTNVGNSRDISADGRYVVFPIFAHDMQPGDTINRQRVYRFDRVSGMTELASVAPDGSPWEATDSAISADGNLVAFGHANQVYVRNMAAGQTDQVSLTHDEQQPNSNAGGADISPDGRYVMFSSSATNLVAAPAVNQFTQVYVRDRVAGTTILVSQNEDEEAANNGPSNGYRIRGHHVMFISSANNLVPGYNTIVNRLYVRNLDTGVLSFLYHTFLGDTDLSDDGRSFVYHPGFEQGIFLRDNVAGTTTRVDFAYDGSLPNGDTSQARVSSDGRYVMFLSVATNLLSPSIPAPTSAESNAYVRDMVLGRTTLISAAYDGTPHMGDMGPRLLATSAPFAVFGSDSTNILLDDANGANDEIYLRQFTFDCDTPVVITHPLAPVVCGNQPIALTVSAVGPDLQYQWSQDGVEIPGATLATYSVAHVDSNDAGLYTVRVYNDCGPVFSQVRVLVLTDLDDTGVIDISDLAMLLSNFGQSGTYDDGDLNGDGLVSLPDLAALLSVFGLPCPG